MSVMSVQCCAVLYSAVQCFTVLCSAAQCCTVLCSAVQCCTVLYSAVQCCAVLCSACTTTHNIQIYNNCCIQLCTKLEALGHIVRKHPFILSRNICCKGRYSLPDTDNIGLSQGRSSISGLALEKEITLNYNYVHKLLR